MKITAISLAVFLGFHAHAQTNAHERLYIPFLDAASQTNIDVKVSDVFGVGITNSLETVNSLSNTNLFRVSEAMIIKKALLAYTSITTNSGPDGTVMLYAYKTNSANRATSRVNLTSEWVCKYQSTNSIASDKIFFRSGSVFIKHRDSPNNGFNVFIARLGSGSSFRFMEIKNGLLNGVLADFRDNHPQGLHWDYKLADFNDGHLVEYRKLTNGMTIGNFFLWNKENRLILQAHFKEPYDFEKHRTDIYQSEKKR